MRQLLERINCNDSRFFPCEVIDAFYFPHSCDIWRLMPLTLDANKAAADPVYYLAATGVACKFLSTAETDVPTMVGRTKSVNIMTLDNWAFPGGTTIQDTDVLKLTSAAVPDGVGKFWSVQGNPKIIEGVPFMPIDTLIVKSKETAPPKGVS